MRKNGCVAVGDTEMYYVAFGDGKRNLVVLPGLSDGIAGNDDKTVGNDAPGELKNGIADSELFV